MINDELYIGKRLYYVNKVVQCIFCRIIELPAIDSPDSWVGIETEYGQRMKVKVKQITGMGKIIALPKEEISQEYLKCRCGSMRFNYDQDSKQLKCQDCQAGYKNDELDMLERTEYIEQSKVEEKIIIN